MIRHIVMFELLTDDPAEKDAQFVEIKTRLEGLRDVIPDVIDLTVSRNCAYEGSNADVVLVSHFPDLDALEAYQVHPAHQEFVTYVGALRKSRAAIDFEV